MASPLAVLCARRLFERPQPLCRVGGRDGRHGHRHRCGSRGEAEPAGQRGVSRQERGEGSVQGEGDEAAGEQHQGDRGSRRGGHRRRFVHELRLRDERPEHERRPGRGGDEGADHSPAEAAERKVDRGADSPRSPCRRARKRGRWSLRRPAGAPQPALDESRSRRGGGAQQQGDGECGKDGKAVPVADRVAQAGSCCGQRCRERSIGEDSGCDATEQRERDDGS